MENRRKADAGPPTMVMQSFQDMGQKGRRKMQAAGAILMTFSSIAGLVVPAIATVAIVYYIFAGMVFMVGAGFFWPQYGVLVFNLIPAAIAKILPAKRIVDTIRPDRRAEDCDDEV